MLEDLLFQIKEIHTKDLADLAIKLEDFSQDDKIIILKENISLLEKLPRPRTCEDEAELKAGLENYHQALAYSGLTEKIRVFIFALANLNKKIKEHLFFNKSANTKDREVGEITSEEMTTAWQNLLPTDNLPRMYAKIAVLAKILKNHLFLDDSDFKKLMFLEIQLKLAYKNDVASKYQDKRAEILKQRDKELERFPLEETLKAKHDGTKRLRSYMESNLTKKIAELESIPEATIVLFDTFNLTLDKEEFAKLEAEKNLLEKNSREYKARLQLDIEGSKNVLINHDQLIAAQEVTLKAIKIIHARADEAIEQLDTTLIEKTAALEMKFKAAYTKKAKERDDGFIEKAKVLYPVVTSINLEDIPGSVFGRQRGSSDSTSPKSMIRNLSLTKFLTGSSSTSQTSPTRPRTSSPGFVSPHRSTSSLFGSSNSNKSGNSSPKDALTPTSEGSSGSSEIGKVITP